MCDTAAMGVNTRKIQNVRDVETTYIVHPHETLIFEDCSDCKYTLQGTCTIVMVTSCENLTLIIDAVLKTHILEIWRSKNINLQVSHLLIIA